MEAELWRLALDRGCGADTRQLALHSARHHADEQQAEGNRGARRRSCIARHARVLGAAACRENRAWDFCNSRVSLGAPAMTRIATEKFRAGSPSSCVGMHRRDASRARESVPQTPPVAASIIHLSNVSRVLG